MLDRRTLLLAAPVMLAACAAPRRDPAADTFTARIAAIETATGGSIGVHVHDTGSGRRLRHRDGERFAFCSTMKAMLAGAALARADRGELAMDRAVPVAAADIVTNSPRTGAAAPGSMTVAQLCSATVEVSDNAAANLLFPLVGDTAGMTAFARTLGDTETRFDRLETALNSNIPGDPRDTTTPAAMAAAIHALLLGDALSAAGRAQLLAWMEAATTGLTALRAGLPPSWRTGDKTGAGANGARNIVALTIPPARAPIVASVYMSGSSRSLAELNAAHAEVGRAIAEALA
jgi:beta-lactamase class A